MESYTNMNLFPKISLLIPIYFGNPHSGLVYSDLWKILLLQSCVCVCLSLRVHFCGLLLPVNVWFTPPSVFFVKVVGPELEDLRS